MAIPEWTHEFLTHEARQAGQTETGTVGTIVDNFGNNGSVVNGVNNGFKFSIALASVSQFTIDFWSYVPAADSAVTTVFPIKFETAGDSKYYQIFHQGTNKLMFRANVGATSYNNQSTDAMASDTWEHWTCVFDNPTRLYLNGVDVGDASPAWTNFDTGTSDNWFGKSAGTFFKGVMSRDRYLIGTALTAAQALEHHNAELDILNPSAPSGPAGPGSSIGIGAPSWAHGGRAKRRRRRR
jgi:hypothetical protein